MDGTQNVDGREEPIALAATSPREARFYIPAIGSPTRPRRTLKHNDTFAVFDSHGDIGASSGTADGLFDCDTRYLSQLELLINGTQPLLLNSAVKDDNLNYYVDLTNPDIYNDGRLLLPKDTVHIARTIYLCDGSLRERIALTNHTADPVTVTLSIVFASDFADIFEVRGIKRDRRGKSWSQVTDENGVLLSYRGLDDVARETAIAFEPTPSNLGSNFGAYDIVLSPGERRTIFVTVASRGRLPKSTVSFFQGLVRLNRELLAATRSVTSIETSNAVLNEMFCRSMADMYMLMTATPQGPYPYAGIPWYSTTFGRDGLITALQMLWLDPNMAAGVLRRLAYLQADKVDPRADASPGKILHEMRGGEMAALHEVPFDRYYGSVDATPLFVMLAGAYLERTGDEDLIQQLWPAIERALVWIDGPGDSDGDGFVEYARGTETGLANQGWKDSYDAVFHADGTLAEGPIALVEVQGYVYAAKHAAAACARRLGFAKRAAELQRQADDLRERFERTFWCEEIGTYALALDGAKSPCRVRTSNAGQVLFTGIAGSERAGRIASAFLTDSYFSGWGIRTVAHGEARYNPMSYHNGSIWPHDNALIARGLTKYGYNRSVEKIFDALMRATSYMDYRRIPELYCGFKRRRGRGPTIYPAACSPQAWAASAPFSLLESMLGMTFDAKAREIRLTDPVLPASAGEITLRNLSLGAATTDIVLRDGTSGVTLETLRATGDIRVSLVTRKKR
jgi:glycogen debranching enzyme